MGLRPHRIGPRPDAASSRCATPRPAKPNPLHYPAVRSALNLELPDPRFADCLNAQVAHLMMGLLDRRTPPGEPTNYPLAWQRDGVAVVAGLVRAGQLEVAKELAELLCRERFLRRLRRRRRRAGPGAARAGRRGRRGSRDPAFDRWLWPHVQRKADLVLKMAAADKPLRMPYVGPIVPEHRQRNDLDLVCEPARDGLIMGRMDFGRPASYITAVSYHGLRGAAALARRLKHDARSRPLAGGGRPLAKGLAEGPAVAGSSGPTSPGCGPRGSPPPTRPAYREQLAQAFRPAAIPALDLFRARR